AAMPYGAAPGDALRRGRTLTPAPPSVRLFHALQHLSYRLSRAGQGNAGFRLTYMGNPAALDAVIELNPRRCALCPICQPNSASVHRNDCSSSTPTTPACATPPTQPRFVP